MAEPDVFETFSSEKIQRSKRRWLISTLVGTIVILLLLLLSLGLLAPWILQWQIQRFASERLGRLVRIGQVQIKPWPLSVTLSDLTVAGIGPSDPPQFSLKRLHAQLALESIWYLTPIVSTIEADNPLLRVRYLGTERYDVSDILERLRNLSKAHPTHRPPDFAFYNIVVQGGHITFVDELHKRTHELLDVRLALPFISNKPVLQKVLITPELGFTFNGNRFNVGAQALPFDESHRAQARVVVKHLDLLPYLGYQPNNLPLRITAGTLDADVSFKFEQLPRPSISLSGRATIFDIWANDAVGRPALYSQRLLIETNETLPFKQIVHLSNVELTQPQAIASRNAQGRINWMPEIKAPKTPINRSASAMTNVSATHNWRVDIARLAIVKGDLQLQDAKPIPGAIPNAKPVAIRMTPLMLEAKNITWPVREPITFTGQATLSDKPIQMQSVSTFSVAGKTVLRSKKTEKFERTKEANRTSKTSRTNRTNRINRTNRTKKNQKISFKNAPLKGVMPANETIFASGPANAPTLTFNGQTQLDTVKVNVQARRVPVQIAQPYLAVFLKPMLTGNLDADAQINWIKTIQRCANRCNARAPNLIINARKLIFTKLALLGSTKQSIAVKRVSNNADRQRSDSRHSRISALPNLPSDSLAHIDALTLENAHLNLQARLASADVATVQSPKIDISRDKQGRWMFQDWFINPREDSQIERTRRTRSKSSINTHVTPWALRLNRLIVTKGNVNWYDQLPEAGAVKTSLSELNFKAKNINLNKRAAIASELTTLLVSKRGEPGKLAWRGTFNLEPIYARGQVIAQRLPLQIFEPYFSQYLNIDVLRADTSFNGQVDFALQRGGMHLNLAGDARIDELRTNSISGGVTPSVVVRASVNDAKPGGLLQANSNFVPAPAPMQRRAADSVSHAALAPSSSRRVTTTASIGEELISWKQLRLAGLKVQIDPGYAPKIVVRDSQLSDFYARIILYPNGRMNLQDLIKAKDPDPARTSTMASTPTPSKVPIVQFGSTRFIHGRIAFSDYFIQPNYSADLTELFGTLSAFSSTTNQQLPQMAELQLTGRAQSTAQLAINGQLNPLVRPLTLNIAAKVTDLELPSLSPYAIKYSGHSIERGKLSMDVVYKIAPNGQLSAANKLVLNQLQFGELVPGAPASLPVTLATTLLADRHGVINLDLPIRGSINDPQFSIGPLIIKAIINLLSKAATAPFALLERAFGDGDFSDMSQVPFAPGSTTLSDSAKAQLDKITKVMIDRPKIRLTILGTAHLEDELSGIKRQRLNSLIDAERRARTDSFETEQTEATDAKSAQEFKIQQVSSDKNSADYARLLRQLYQRADVPEKPRNFLGMTKNVSVAQMESLLLAHISVTEADIRQLAIRRAVAVKDYLLGQSLSANRVFIGAPKINENGNVTTTPKSGAHDASSGLIPVTDASVQNASAAWTPHVQLELGL
jgi:hypothetical protein